ncbi:MAG TPA: response regulator [Actinomycetota bacterium]|jgi:CheY-like chemotaxis protein|nr:response regulator [Actinomycetota bacterium]
MSHGRILIVDDHELDRRLSRLDLETAGYTVSEAGGVTDALELLTKQRFDVIILDVVMPGTDGLTFLRGLKSGGRLAEIPVVMLSASDDLDDQLQAMAGGADRYIVKPSHRDVLAQTIESVLEEARGRRGGHPSGS